MICHGAWTLASAGALSGRRVTSWPSLRDDLVNAGADWVDRAVVVDDSGPNVVVSSRNPDDLPEFCEAIVEQFALPNRSQPSVRSRSEQIASTGPTIGTPPA